MTYLLLVAGLIALYLGAEWLVHGAARIAAALNVAPHVIGLTVVAFGTSMPEVVAGATAAWNGSTDIVLGNVLGSNIANVGLILGLAALLRPVPVGGEIARREIPMMLAATIVTIVLAATGAITPLHGAGLFAGLLAFTWVTLRWVREEPETTAAAEAARLEQELGLGEGTSLALEAGRVVLGLLALIVGAQLLVDAAITLAREFGVSELIISVSVVAIGTSLPELATSVVAVVRGQVDVLVGNIVGSNIFNLLGALAVAAMIRPVPVSADVLWIEFPVAFGFSVMLALALRTQGRVTRIEGAVGLAAYVTFIALRVA